MLRQEFLNKTSVLLKILVFASAYAVVAKACLNFFSQNGIVSIIWAPSGIALAGLLLGGKKYIPGVFLGAFATNYFALQSIGAGQALGIAFGNTLEAVFGFWMLNRKSKFDNTLSSLNSFFQLFFGAGFGGSVIAAVVGSSVIYFYGLIPEEKYLLNIIHWWMGDSLGIILGASFILVWSEFDLKNTPAKRILLAVLFIAISVLFGQVVFVGWFSHSPAAQIARGYWMFLIIAVAAIIFQNRVMLAILVCIAFQSIMGAYLGVGFFGNDIEKTQLSNFWFYMLILTFVGMTLSSYITERKKIERELEKSEEKLTTAQSLAHIGHWDFDIQNGLVSGSAELYRIFGLTGKEASLNAFADAVHPEDREFDLAHIQRGMEFGESWNIEHRLLLKDGILKYVNAIGQAIQNEEGKTIHLFGTVQDITDRKKAEERLNQSFREKETLTRELYHRTKNTLQVIRSILLLQAENFAGNKDLQQLIKDSDLRIQAIIIVHNLLYKSKDLSRISLEDYIRELCSQTLKNFEGMNERISLKIEVEDQNILLDTAIPLGLVVNELLTNSLKHGFPENRKGRVTISSAIAGEGLVRMIFSDDGIGVAPEFDFRMQQTLGMKFIFSIGEKQMQGQVNFETQNGLKCIFDFPITLYRPRV